MRKIYTLLVLFIMLTAAGMGAYIYFFSKNVPACQSEATCFTKTTKDTALLKKAQAMVRGGHYTLEANTKKAKHMPTRLHTYITTDDVDGFVTQTVPQKSAAKNMRIKYTIYENDKRDPNKKSSSCKLFAGYLYFEFLLEDESVYTIQMDFVEEDKAEIKKRIQCIFESFFAAI